MLNFLNFKVFELRPILLKSQINSVSDLPPFCPFAQDNK